MTTQLHDTGEEFAIKDLFRSDQLSKPASVSIGLFNDSTDALSDNSDTGDITTEPTGSAYAAQSASFGGSDFSPADNASGNWEVTIADQVFDTSDSSQDVDAYYIEVSFQSDDTGDSSANPHLFWTGDLDQTYDLNSVDQFTLSGSGLEIN